MTCKSDILETLWAAKSILKFVSAPLVFHDDGSFDDSSVRILSEHFPDATIVARQDSDRKTLPLLSDFATAWRRRNIFFLRVFDFQAWADGTPYLQLDSDVLFFEPPTELLRAGANARFNCGRQDDWSNLAWRPEHIESATGVKLLGGFNAGLLYTPHRFDFSRIEHNLRALGEPTNPWPIEQTILNLECASMGMEALPRRYDIYESGWPDVISEHYVERSRLNMYRLGYQRLRPHLIEGRDGAQR